MNQNPQAVRFCNERVRPMADLITSSYLSAKKLLFEFAAQGISSAIPADGVVIDDGAATDGRPIMADASALAVVARCSELVNWMERGTLDSSGTPDNAKLFTLGVAVNGRVIF